MRLAKCILAAGISLEIAAVVLGAHAIRIGPDESEALVWLVGAALAAVAGMAAIIGGLYLLMGRRTASQ